MPISSPVNAPLAAALAALPCAPAFGQAPSVDLSRYSIVRTVALPATAAAEASSITYNWDRDSLFVVGDGGAAIVEVSKAGSHLSTMTLTGFGDTEGLAYLGNGQFVIVEERIQTIYRLTYVPGGTVARGTLPSVVLGPAIGNDGLEGASFDPRTGTFVIVKEKTPPAIYHTTANFTTGVGTNTTLFNPAQLGVLDLADVQCLATLATADPAERDCLLIISQQSASLLKCSRQGAVYSRFSLAGISDTAEGVTIDRDGVIYLCDETPRMFVLKPDLSPAGARPKP